MLGRVCELRRRTAELGQTFGWVGRYKRAKPSTGGGPAGAGGGPAGRGAGAGGGGPAGLPRPGTRNAHERIRPEIPYDSGARTRGVAAGRSAPRSGAATGGGGPAGLPRPGTRTDQIPSQEPRPGTRTDNKASQDR